MNLYDVYPMKKGTLITANGYRGEEDFNRIQKVITEQICPDDQGYSVDSMCIGAYMRKGGILLQSSSDGPFDCCTFFYKKNLPDTEVRQIMDWITMILTKMAEE